MTRFQLRRLALQATRRPELLPVLQDALLESATYGPRFEQAIAVVHHDSASPLFPWATTFLVAWDPRGDGTHFVAFATGRPTRNLLRDIARQGLIPVYLLTVPERS